MRNWIVLDQNNQPHIYSNFRDALKHKGESCNIMTEEYYRTTYQHL